MDVDFPQSYGQVMITRTTHAQRSRLVFSSIEGNEELHGKPQKNAEAFFGAHGSLLLSACLDGLGIEDIPLTSL